MAATLSSQNVLSRTIPPLGSREDRCSSNVLLHASFAGSGEPAHDRAERELANHRFPLPISRVCRASDIRHGHPRALRVESVLISGADSIRRGERHDQGSSTTIRLSPNPRDTEGVRRHRDYARAVPSEGWRWRCSHAGKRNSTSGLGAQKQPATRPIQWRNRLTQLHQVQVLPG